MTELDLLNVARASGQAVTSDFAQVITISFAMVVAIYYFLHQAGLRMKWFAFLLYTCGMFTYLGMMLMESAVAIGAVKALQAIPASQQALPTAYLLGMRTSWVGITCSVLVNLVYWILWIGMSLLLFFWKRPAEVASSHE
jgi:hypothetical protein